MKWYKKQMDEIMGKDSKSSKSGGATNSSRNPFAVKKTGSNKITFLNPVAISKKNRPKTDSI